MTKATPDHAAAQVHRREAERHYEAEARLRRIGLDAAADSAHRLAIYSEQLADMLLLQTRPKEDT